MTDAAAGSTGAEAQAAAAAAAPGAPSPADAAAAAAASTAAQQAAAQQGAQAGAEGAQVDTSAWPEDARTAYEKARADATRYQREAGDQRINAKANAAAEERKKLLADFTKIFDPEAAANATPTVETLTTQISGVQAERDDAKRQAAAVAQAWTQGVDPAKLGYLQYQLAQDPAYKALDLGAPDFSDSLKSLVAGKIAADATLKLPVGAAASGVETLGGANGSAAITPEAFAAMNITERTNLYKTDKATYDKLVAAS